MKAVVNVVAAVVLLIGVSRATGADFDVAKFNALSKADRIAVVTAALKTRDAALNNLSLQLTERSVQLKAGQPGTPYRQVTRLIKILDKKFLVTSTSGSEQNDISLWDGTVCSSYSKQGDVQSGNIASDLWDVYSISYLDMLGLLKTSWIRTPEGGPVKLYEWLQTQLRHEALIKNGAIRGQTTLVVECKAEQQDGLAVVIVAATETLFGQQKIDEYRFDPNRGFMPVCNDLSLGLQQSVSHITVTVKASKQVGDLWIPALVEKDHRNSATPDDCTRRTFEVTAAEVGVVKPEEMILKLPAGTAVTDDVKHRAYQIQSDGTIKEMRYVDYSGTVRVPKE